MIQDENGLLVSEIWPDTTDEYKVANRGDSMANSARADHLFGLLNHPMKINLTPFVTVDGYVRHPSPLMPKDWCETDSPTDQCLPFYIAGTIEQKIEMRYRIKKANWRTGNGDLVSPIFAAIITHNTFMLNIFLAAQVLIFKLPVRWSDSKHNFELSANSSGDVLNWFHAVAYGASSWVRKLVTKDWLKKKIADYFADEPNSIWLVDLYNQAIDKIYV